MTSSWVHNRESSVLKYVHYTLQKNPRLKFVPGRLKSQLQSLGCWKMTTKKATCAGEMPVTPRENYHPGLKTDSPRMCRNLNENIFQVQLTVGLTDAWEKLESSQATGRIKLDPTFRARVSILVQLVRDRDLTGLTYLLQSHLCYLAMVMTPGWVHNPKLDVLKSVYQHLSASGEHHIINTK